MEEASVAGESPDKSEQQKSSGTTRSEADPRLAVFREPASPADAGSGADTATAVFRTPRPGPEAPDADDRAVDEADGEAPAGAAAGATADAGAESGAEPEAADVDDAAEGADAGARAERDADGEGDAADDAAEADEVTPAEPEAAGDVEGAAEASEGAESPATAPEAGTGPAKASEEPAEGVEPTEGAEPEEDDARLRDAVAAWVSTDGDGDGESAAPGPDADAPAPDAAAAESGEGDVPAGDEAADNKAAVDETPAEAAASKDAPADEDTTVGDPAADSAAEETSTDADSTDADSAEETSADETSGGAAPDSAAGARVPRTREESGEKAVLAGDAGGIDQATAVFKAPRLPRVDQPTTALKITPPPAESKPKPKPETESRPESPAERTSKFVPLRADDVRPAPAPRTPETPAPVPVPPGAGQQPSAASLSGAERTRQQPMPPRPPLDLLAELTNTPPPPETPVRTAVRRVKIWTPLVILLLIAFAIVQMVRPLPTPALTMTAEPAYTFKGGDLNLSWPEQGQSAITVDGVGSFGSAGAQKPAPIASVAKIMTAYVILKEHPITGKEQGEKITVDQQAEDESKAEDESTAPISKGQQFTEKQMLQLLMIPSGNNAARLFARWDSSETEFIGKMNAAAKDLGMSGTTYTDPSGLKKTTVSTAADQLKLAKAVMQNEIFREIVDTPQIDIPGVDGTIYNNNTILLKPGVSGIKTGSSTPAGGNLVWSANTVVDGKKLWIYGAVMGQQAGTGQPYDSLAMSLDNSLKLIEEAQKAVTSATVVKKGDVVGYVDDGFGGHTPLVATADLKAKGWPGLKVELSVQGNGEEISRSMTAGTKVGVVTVGTGPGKVSAPVALQQDLRDPGFGQKLTRIG
ncbi:serine hydrolase [Streptomyces sp. NPDC005803]|uniref:D-alanyl-D-alanine carboxypeptidase n=1 Tax=Streptomyces sp. NPDC005803 TaxID=3154297 RepID=UPI0033E24AEF